LYLRYLHRARKVGLFCIAFGFCLQGLRYYRDYCSGNKTYYCSYHFVSPLSVYIGKSHGGYMPVVFAAYYFDKRPSRMMILRD
jgi:hypothetical protein